jgi:hypothetical protein
MLLGRVEAQVQIDGEERPMAFITDNLSGSPHSVCHLYRWRWDGGGGVIKFRNAVKPSKLVTQAGKDLVTQNSREQNQKSHNNSESGC